MSGTEAPKVKLDWSRLLGFDQAAAPPTPAAPATGLNDPRLAKLGAKFGGKPGVRAPA